VALSVSGGPPTSSSTSAPTSAPTDSLSTEPSPTPDDILLALLDERQIAQLVRTSTTPPETLAGILRTADTHLRMTIAAHPNADADLISRAARDPQCDVRGVVAGREDTPIPVLSSLRSDRSKYVRIAVAENPHTSRSDLDSMVDDPEAAVRRRLVTADVSRSTVDRLSRDRVAHIRALVVTCRDLDPVLAERLASDRDHTVRAAAAARRLRPDLLVRLAGDPHPDVARTVAGHSWAPLDAVLEAAGHPSEDVRLVAATIHGHRDEVGEALWADPDRRVRHCVARSARSEAIATRMVGDDAPMVRLALARRPGFPEEHLLTLARDRSVSVVEAVLAHPRCPTRVLLDGLSSNRRSIRWTCRERLRERGVMADPTTLLDRRSASLADLLWWADTVVDHARLAEAMSDPHLPQAVALAILGRPEPDERILLAAMFSERPAVRCRVASIASAPERILRTLAGDPATTVRAAVADHTTTTDTVLRRLARDPQTTVRAAARANLAARRAAARWRRPLGRHPH